MKRILIVLCSLFSVMFLQKGMQLWLLLNQWAGDEITISFLGIEIISGVNNENVSGYALGFSVAGLIPILFILTISIKTRVERNNEQQDVN